jgi:hypothetical protein
VNNIPTEKKVPTYLDVGKDEGGNQLCLFFPNVMLFEVKANDDVELTFQTGLTRMLVGKQAKSFLEITGLRAPETKGIVVPPVLLGRNINS